MNVEINQEYFSYRRSTFFLKYYQRKKHILLYIQAIYFFSNFCLLSVIKHFQIYNTPRLLIYFSLIKNRKVGKIMIIQLGCLNAVLSPLQNKCSFLIRNCIPFSQECLIPRFFDVCSGFRRWKVSNCNIAP